MKFMQLISSGEQEPVWVDVQWHLLNEQAKQNLYYLLKSNGGNVHLIFGEYEVQELIRLRIIANATMLEESLAREDFDYFLFSSPPAKAHRLDYHQPNTPVAMVKYKSESEPREINLGGVSTNDLADLLFKRP